MSEYARYKQITRKLCSSQEEITCMQCSLTADDMQNTLILSVTKVIVYSANHKPETSAY